MPETPVTSSDVTDSAGTSTDAALLRTAIGAPFFSAPLALVKIGVTVAFEATVRKPERSSRTVRASLVSLMCTTVARLPVETAAALEMSPTLMSRSPGRM
jgi:hypothetical protein